MPYTYQSSKGTTYYLNSKVTKLRNGREQRIYFFSKEPKSETGMDSLPSGFQVHENNRTGLPMLKKKES